MFLCLYIPEFLWNFTVEVNYKTNHVHFTIEFHFLLYYFTSAGQIFHFCLRKWQSISSLRRIWILYPSFDMHITIHYTMYIFRSARVETSILSFLWYAYHRERTRKLHPHGKAIKDSNLLHCFTLARLDISDLYILWLHIAWKTNDYAFISCTYATIDDVSFPSAGQGNLFPFKHYFIYVSIFCLCSEGNNVIFMDASQICVCICSCLSSIYVCVCVRICICYGITWKRKTAPKPYTYICILFRIQRCQ